MRKGYFWCASAECERALNAFRIPCLERNHEEVDEEEKENTLDLH